MGARSLKAAAGAAGLVLALGGCSLGQGVQTAGSGAPTASGAAVSVPAQYQPSTYLDPAAFAAKIKEPGVVVIDVHTPDQGTIPGTTLKIPYNQIRTNVSKLPADKSTPLAVYCRSGSMSAMAVRELAGLGYRNLFELGGGFNAWKASGRSMLPPGS